MGDNLIVMLQGDLEDGTVEQIEREVTREVARTQARGALHRRQRAVRRGLVRRADHLAHRRDDPLLGSDATIVGIQPAVALTLVELGRAAQARRDGAHRGAGDGPLAGIPR
jgi:rsbT antagonist protein RsbS